MYRLMIEPGSLGTRGVGEMVGEAVAGEMVGEAMVGEMVGASVGQTDPVLVSGVPVQLISYTNMYPALPQFWLESPSHASSLQKLSAWAQFCTLMPAWLHQHSCPFSTAAHV